MSKACELGRKMRRMLGSERASYSTRRGQMLRAMWQSSALEAHVGQKGINEPASTVL